jgi:hypothetical protein
MTTDDVRVLKSSTCSSLAGRTTLTSEIGAYAASGIFARVTKSSGTGTFSKDWIALGRVHAVLEKNGAKPITLATLGPLFRGLSANTAGFLLAVLKHEGLVRAAEDQARAYERTDGKAFFEAIKPLLVMSTGATPPRSAKPRKTASASKATAPAAKPRPAIYVSEVHGPLTPGAKPKPARKS